VLSTSSAFVIEQIQLTSFTGGNYYKSGQTANITWTSSNISQIKIEYSLNNGTAWTTLAPTVTASLGTYAWNIDQNLSSTQTLIRISDAANSAVSSQSGSVFVVGTIAVTSPNNGEFINAGTSYNITWTNSSSVSNVSIEYSTDNGSTWTFVINNTPADGSHLWDVPSSISTTQALIRITDAASGNAISDASDNIFTVTSLVLISPNGGENYQIGSVQNITWTPPASVSNIKIEYYSHTNKWSIIAPSISAALGTYSWTIPNDATDSAKVRITSITNPTIVDQSSAIFRVSNVNLTAPDGNERWQAGTTQAITWTNSTNVSLVDLYFINGAVSTLIKAGDTASAGSYSWTVPDNATQTARVRIFDAASNKSVKDSSALTFIIPKLAVTQPALGETWLAASSKLIKWQSSADIDSIDIEYSTDNGSTWKSIKRVKASTLQYTWTVPSSINSSNSLIKVTDKNYTSITGTSAKFTLLAPSLTLTAPNGGEYWQIGTLKEIKWTNSTDISNIKIELSLDNGVTYSKIVTSSVAASDQKYEWAVPSEANTNQAKIRLSDAVNTFILDESDFNFTIGGLNLISPNGGENWQAGSTMDITWENTSAVQNVKLGFSTDSGTTWTTILSSTPAVTGKYSWLIPNVPTANGKVRVSDVNSTSISDQSESVFLVSLLKLTAPNGGKNYKVGSTLPITWTNSSNIMNVNLEYSADNGVSWKSINSSTITAADGTFNWVIPSEVCSDKMLVRVLDALYPNVIDASDAVFNTKGLTLSSPSSGNLWRVGTTEKIQWDYCNISKINIKYSTNNGSTWLKIQDSVDATLKSHSWVIPNNISQNVLVGLYDIADVTISSISSSFQIYTPTISLTSPNGGENWQAGSTKSIVWTTQFIDNVKIEYSLDNGVTYKVVTESTPSGQTYSWTIPDSVETTSSIVKVSDASETKLKDSSFTPFSIGRLELKTPTGGEYWQANTKQNITWYASASISKLKLQYSLNGGSTWSNIIGGTSVTASSNTFSWTIPQNLSSSIAKIRIANSADTSMKSISSGIFNLGWIQVSKPIVGENYQNAKKVTVQWTNSASVEEVQIDLIDIKKGVNKVINIGDTTASVGKYTFIIPDGTITDSAVVRLSDNNSAYSISDSSGIFRISDLSLTNPVAAANWQASSKQTVRWTHTSDISLITLEYSTNSGSTWATMVPDYDATKLSYDWDIPGTLSSEKSIVRIYNSNNRNIADTSAVFNIYQKVLSITSPNGGEYFNAGDTATVTWNVDFNTNTLKLQYSSDNGTTWNQISPSVASLDKKFKWAIPKNLSTNQGLIKIIDNADTTRFDISDASFTIGWITITEPVIGENFRAGLNKVIKWQNSASVSTVNIYYTTVENPAETDWLSIQLNVTASLGEFNWSPIPQVSSTNAQISIRDAASNKMIYDLSDKFSVSILELLSPNGGEFWQSGKTETVTWTASSNLTNLRIELSTDNGTSWNLLKSNVAASAGTASVSITDGILSDSALVRLYDQAYPSIADTSDKIFPLGSLTLLTQKDGDRIMRGNIVSIQWQGSSNLARVNIEYKTKPNGVWRPIELRYPADSGKYNWLVDAQVTDSAYLRISDSDNPSFKDENTKPFEIVNLKLTSFNSAYVYQTGTTQEISWQSDYIDFIAVEYTKDTTLTADWKRIALLPGDSTKVSWSLANLGANDASKYYRVRIKDVSDSKISDTSDNFFSITYIRLSEPNGGGGQQIGTQYKVKWQVSSSTVDKINLKVKSTESGDYTLINNTPITASDLEYTWNIITPATGDGKLLIEDASNPHIYDESDSVFTISEIVIASPNGGERYQVGRYMPIKWSSKFISKVKIEYKLQKNTAWIPISGAQNLDASLAEYKWLIKDTEVIASNEVRVRITDATFSTVYDTSEAQFIIAKLSVTSPNKRIAWQNKTTKTIEWKSEFLDTVRILVDQGNGNLTPISGPVSAKDLKFDWDIPENVLTSAAKIIVLDYFDPTISDSSDESFLIGTFPKLSVKQDYFRDGVNLLLNFDTPNENIELVGVQYKKSNSTVWFPGTTSLAESYSFVGPVADDTIKWLSKSPLADYEGPIDIIASFKSEFNVTYPVQIDSVGIDNKAPVFSVSSFSIKQDPYLLGWDKGIAKWTQSTDLNMPITYAFTSDSASFNSRSTTLDSLVFNDLTSSTRYNFNVTVSDALGNANTYNSSLRTQLIADFNNDTAVDVVDVAAFANSWGSADSTLGADFAPYQGNFPNIRVNGDFELNIGDVLFFVDAWYYYKTQGRFAKTNPLNEIPFTDVERKTMNFVKGSNQFQFPIDLDTDENLIAHSIEIAFNTSSFSIDSLDVSLSENRNLLMLSYIDSLNGRAYLEFADLAGNLNEAYNVAASLNYFADTHNIKDSLMISVRSFNKKLNEVVNKFTIYTLQQIPNNFVLYQNYPNPFNPSTTIMYDLPQEVRVNIKLYDLLGQEIATIVNMDQKPGTHKLEIDLRKLNSGLASGVYFYRMTAGKFVKTKKMLLLK
ncbi:MAG: T9SS type A sorting domain-containing protein, partial [Bacteroidota bacterium]